jgi:hypothetical protein
MLDSGVRFVAPLGPRVPAGLYASLNLTDAVPGDYVAQHEENTTPGQAGQLPRQRRRLKPPRMAGTA